MFKMTEKEKLAYEIAKKAHAGQVDKAGVDYINHPLYVAEHCNTENERIVALLHDVVEDTDVTLEDLSKVFDQEIVEAVDCITHHDEVDYETYLKRVKANPIACAVKIQDITNNLDISRIKNPTKKDYQRLNKYEQAICFLTDTMLI